MSSSSKCISVGPSVISWDASWRLSRHFPVVHIVYNQLAKPCGNYGLVVYQLKFVRMLIMTDW
jgi:hypothetical protein